MACPKCKCRVTYYHSVSSDGYDRDKCSCCGNIFFTMDAEDEEDLNHEYRF